MFTVPAADAQVVVSIAGQRARERASEFGLELAC